jgi:hypothetical protein
MSRPQYQAVTPSKVSPPRSNVTPYTASKDHVRRLESARGMQRGKSFMAEKASATADFGGKNISYFAGIALLINNITGPGVPQLPNIFAEAGWLVPTIIILVVRAPSASAAEAPARVPASSPAPDPVMHPPAPAHPRHTQIWVMTSLSTVMYCEAMRKIPGNEHFRGRIEFTTIVKYYFGDCAYVCAQIGLNGALQSLNIISVIQSAQVMDNTISTIWGALAGPPACRCFAGSCCCRSAPRHARERRRLSSWQDRSASSLAAPTSLTSLSSLAVRRARPHVKEPQGSHVASTSRRSRSRSTAQPCHAPQRYGHASTPTHPPIPLISAVAVAVVIPARG